MAAMRKIYLAFSLMGIISGGQYCKILCWDILQIHLHITYQISLSQRLQSWRRCKMLKLYPTVHSTQNLYCTLVIHCSRTHTQNCNSNNISIDLLGWESICQTLLTPCSHNKVIHVTVSRHSRFAVVGIYAHELLCAKYLVLMSNVA